MLILISLYLFSEMFKIDKKAYNQYLFKIDHKENGFGDIKQKCTEMYSLHTYVELHIGQKDDVRFKMNTEMKYLHS